jgi:hypothetical protein
MFSNYRLNKKTKTFMKSVKQTSIPNYWKYKVLSIIFIIGTLMSSCTKDDDQELPAFSYVSVFNGSSDSPPLDIIVSNRKINRYGINYTESFPYNRFFIGDRQFQFSPFNALNSLLDKTFKIEDNKIYSVFLSNISKNMEAYLVEDIWQNPDADHAQIRFIHLSPDAGKVNFKFTASDLPGAENIEYQNPSVFVKIKNGKHQLSVTSNGQNLLNPVEIEFKGNRVYTIILRGLKTTEDNQQKVNLQLLTNFIKQ